MQEAIDLLEQLVRLPSPPGQEHEASKHLTKWMRAHGFDASMDETGNATGRRGDGEREIMLLGHIDTFAGEVPVRREGDMLYGRGTVDAKGSLCAFAVAAAQVHVPAGWRVTVAGAVEEEAATSKGARHLLERHRPACCIIGEPSGWDRVTLGYKGRLLVEYRYRGPLAHSAGPVLLPAERAVAFWNAVVAYVNNFNVGRDRAFDRLDPSLYVITTHSEGAFGSVQMSLGLRLPLDLTPGQVSSELSKLAEQPPAGSLNLREVTELKVAFSGGEVAFRGNKNTPLVRALLAAIRGHGGQPRFVVKTGTSDMNVVGPAWRCPIVAYGPGDSALDHTPDEHIVLQEYIQAIEVLKSTLETLMRSPDDRRSGLHPRP
jgi:LysW-gamma-L-lysine carboxypeptidase